MSIQKKSLISTLKTAKKANVAADNKGEKQVSAKNAAHFKAVGHVTLKAVDGKSLKSLKQTSLRLVQ